MRWRYHLPIPDTASSSKTRSPGLFVKDEAPQPAPGVARLALQREEQRLVADVPRHGHDLRVTAPHQLGVDHRVADPDVSEQPAVAAARAHVQLQPHAPPLDERPFDGRALPAPRLLALR